MNAKEIITNYDLSPLFTQECEKDENAPEKPADMRITLRIEWDEQQAEAQDKKMRDRGYRKSSYGGHSYSTEGEFYEATYTNILQEEEYKAACKKHTAQVEAARRTRAELKRMIKAELFERLEVCYVRFGKIPANGYSYNFRDNFFEKGVSCYRAVRYNGKYIIDTCNPFTFYSYADTKQLYEVRGDVLTEMGSDDEPLLANATIMRKIPTQNYEGVNDFICNVAAGVEPSAEVE